MLNLDYVAGHLCRKLFNRFLCDTINIKVLSGIIFANGRQYDTVRSVILPKDCWPNVNKKKSTSEDIKKKVVV